ncbi:MAG: hypothetical protein AUK48_14580 [Oscillatoriales cyanobacterium CG2_30_44_21]|nr:MAG: hypothetical protein AUK48_14580 [Oscillatoriales cyanobacterium CG2_30_44_21]
MESDQLPVEENLNTFSDMSPPEESSELIVISEDESKNIPENQEVENVEVDPSLIELATSELGEQSPDPKTTICSESSVVIVDIEQLKQEQEQLKTEIDSLKNTKSKILESQIDDLQSGIIRIAQADLARLEYQKQELQAAIAVLEKRKDRLDKEMTTTYAGASQDIAVRVQGFKDYLVGSLQDLVASAEKLNFAPPPAKPDPEPVVTAAKKAAPEPEVLLLSAQSFADYKQRVDQLLDRYRTLPDYYGAAWKLRRTFEQVHADRVSKWFFEQAGRGAIRTMGTRLQNILVASAAISVLKAVYGDKLRVLVLATSPERLGEWRRGFQDCLGLTREHFGSDKGIALFEDPEPLATKGDRLVKEQLMPIVVIDESEELIAVDLLRFPLLIAFGGAPESRTPTPSTFINNRESQNNKDYIRENPREYNQNSGSRESRDYPSRNYGGDRETRNTGYGGDRGRSNQESDWDW